MEFTLTVTGIKIGKDVAVEDISVKTVCTEAEYVAVIAAMTKMIPDLMARIDQAI